MEKRVAWAVSGALALLVGCTKEPPHAAPSDSGGATPGLTQLTYTPSGCGYAVRTPEVIDPSMGSDVEGSVPSGPDHVHVSFAGPTSSTFAVNWRTDLGTKWTYVLYGTDEQAVTVADVPGPGVARQIGHTFVLPPSSVGAGEVRLHEVHVCGLDPDTRYFYKVGGPGHWSGVFDVSAGPALGSTAPWSFAVTGDARNDVDNAWPLANRRLYEAGVDLEVFTGDAVAVGTDESAWNRFFEEADGDLSVQDVLARVPFMAANGNHEDLAVNYIAQFAFPQQESPGERGTGEEWYSFDYANAHFAVLNDTVVDDAVLTGSEASWLRSDLGGVDRSKTPWVFVVHHRPYYTCMSGHPPDLALRAAWQPIMDQYDVDIVFNGHNHVYERSRPIRGLNGTDGVLAAEGPNDAPTVDGSGRASGTLYVVEGGAGAPLYPVGDGCPFTAKAQATRSWVEVRIADRTLTFTARDLMSGAVLDTFEYTK